MWVAVWVVLTVLVATPAEAAPASSDTQEAKRHYQAGVSAYALGDFLKAAEEYKAAFKLKPDPVFLYNTAQSYRLGGDLKQAVFFYSSYLSQAPRAPNRREVEDRIAKLEAQLEEQQKAAAAAAAAAQAPAPVVVTPPPPEPAAVVVTTPPPRHDKPLVKKWWLWTAVGAVVVVGVGLGVGLGIGLQPKAPSSRARHDGGVLVRAALLTFIALCAGCSSGTYVSLAIEAGSAMPSGVTSIDLDLVLGDKHASASLGDGKKTIALPTSAALQMNSGTGHLVIVANARSATGDILAQGKTAVEVVGGKTVHATVSFGDDTSAGTTDGGTTDIGAAGDGACPAGFVAASGYCNDIDECAATPAPCDPNATCTNTTGSFTCACNAGYSGDGATCTQAWMLLTEIPDLDLLNLGHAFGIGKKIYIGQETSGTQTFTAVDVSTSPPALTNLPEPPLYNSTQNEWCGCGNSGGIPAVLLGASAWIYGAGLEGFDSATQMWTDDTAVWESMISPLRYKGSGAAIGNKIYMIGGQDSSFVSIFNSVQVADVSTPSAPTFSVLPMAENYPVGISESAVTNIGSKIYVFGGQAKVGSQNQPTAKSNVIDLSSKSPSWSALPDLPFDLHFGPVYSPAYKGKIRIFSQTQKLETFDPDSQTWSSTDVDAPGGGSNTGSGWIPVVTTLPTEGLYAVNYVQTSGAVKIVIYKYLLE